MKIQTMLFTVALACAANNATAQASSRVGGITAQDRTNDTEIVWQHHIDAWGNRDLAGILADYDETSLMVVNGKTYRGLAEIRFVFESLFRIFDNGQNRIDPALIDGRLVYIMWHFTTNGHSEFFGTDTFLIEDGKIKIQTIASPLYDAFPLEEGGK